MIELDGLILTPDELVIAIEEKSDLAARCEHLTRNLTNRIADLELQRAALIDEGKRLQMEVAQLVGLRNGGRVTVA